ncbi:hypothetical protein MBLNU230_g7070t1 [Neophaeotheca triangularis]
MDRWIAMRNFQHSLDVWHEAVGDEDPALTEFQVHLSRASYIWGVTNRKVRYYDAAAWFGGKLPENVQEALARCVKQVHEHNSRLGALADQDPTKADFDAEAWNRDRLATEFHGRACFKKYFDQEPAFVMFGWEPSHVQDGLGLGDCPFYAELVEMQKMDHEGVRNWVYNSVMLRTTRLDLRTGRESTKETIKTAQQCLRFTRQAKVLLQDAVREQDGRRRAGATDEDEALNKTLSAELDSLEEQVKLLILADRVAIERGPIGLEGGPATEAEIASAEEGAWSSLDEDIEMMHEGRRIRSGEAHS